MRIRLNSPKGWKDSDICETRSFFWCPHRLFLLGSNKSWRYKTHSEIQKIGRILLEPGSILMKGPSFLSPARQFHNFSWLDPSRMGASKWDLVSQMSIGAVAGPIWVPTRRCDVYFMFLLDLNIYWPQKWDLVSQMSNGAVAGPIWVPTRRCDGRNTGS